MGEQDEAVPIPRALLAKVIASNEANFLLLETLRQELQDSDRFDALEERLRKVEGDTILLLDRTPDRTLTTQVTRMEARQGFVAAGNVRWLIGLVVAGWMAWVSWVQVVR